MTRTPANVIVRGTRPNGTELVLYRSGPAAGPAPAGQITIQWSRPTPRDHSAAGRIGLTIVTPPGHPAAILTPETKIRVTVILPGAAGVDVAVGWITEWRATEDARGYTWYRIDCEDVIAHAANAIAGDIPWPQESAAARAAHINAASSAGPLLDPNGSMIVGQVIARDVDRRSVLELAQLTADPGDQIHPSQYGLQARGNGGYWSPTTSLNAAPRWLPPGSGPLEPGLPLVVTIPTNAIEDTGRIMSRRKRLTHVDLDCPNAAGEMVTVSLAADTTAPTIARHQITTDQLGKDTNDGSALWLEGPYLVTESKKVIHHLPPARLILNRLPASALAALINIDHRAVNVLYLDGPLRLPLSRAQIITSGTLVLHGPYIEDLTVEMQDAGLAGIRGITWAYFQAPPRLLNFRTSPTKKLTFRASRTIHIGKEG